MKSDNNLESVGARIKYCRERKGITQVDLAESIGVSRSTLQGWESNEHPVSSEMIIELCEVLGISADFLLGTGLSGIRPTEEELSSLSYLEILNDRDAKKLFDSLNGLTLRGKKAVVNVAFVLADEINRMTF